MLRQWAIVLKGWGRGRRPSWRGFDTRRRSPSVISLYIHILCPTILFVLLNSIYSQVVEPSKHPPEVLPLRVWVGVYEGQWQGGELGHVTASDLDPYDKLEFSVPATPQFTVDPRQGTLKARGSLAPGVHAVNISVTDGKYSSAGVVTVTVQPLLQDMLQSSVYIRQVILLHSHGG